MNLKTKNCWELKGCPASFYLNCNAYSKKVSCWEIKEGCLCHLTETCESCSIYQDYLKISKKIEPSPN